MEKHYWYAVMKDHEDSDWGTGSFDLSEAKSMALANLDIYPNGYIAVIDGDVCVEEITLDELIKRKLPIGFVKKCELCGNPLPPRRKMYCSDACKAEANRIRAKEQYKPTGKHNMQREKECPDCGIMFVGHVNSLRCKDCQREAYRKIRREYRRRKAAGHVREYGSIDLCQRCGQEYYVMGGIQKYCPSCGIEVDRVNRLAAFHNRYISNPEYKTKKLTRQKRDEQQYVCAVCGKVYMSSDYSITCSNECRTLYNAAYGHVYRKVVRAKTEDTNNNASWQGITEEKQQEIILLAQKKYHERKANEDSHNPKWN